MDNFVNLNKLLVGHKDHLDDNGLKRAIHRTLYSDLKDEIDEKAADLDNCANLHKWISKVVSYHERFIRLWSNLDERMASKRAGEFEDRTTVPKKGKSSAEPTVTPAPTTSTTSTTVPRTPPLSADERALLLAHNGCYKCRRPYAGHRRVECSALGADPAFIPLTEAKCLAARPAQAAASTSSAATSAPAHTIAAVRGPRISDISFHTANDSSSDSIFARNRSNIVHGDSSDDEVRAPEPVPHLIWQAKCLARDGAPILVTTMLDTGADLVLVSEDCASRLRLHKRPLTTPIPVTAAFTNSSAPLPTIQGSLVLSHYVAICLSTSSFSWSSKPVAAVVCPSLCVDVLLGMPFLCDNNIVIDSARRSALVKDANVDLLKTVTKPTGRPRTQQRNVFIDVIDELKRLHRSWPTDQPVFPIMETVPSFVTCIVQHLALVDFKTHLAQMEEQVKDEFADIFEPLPHTSELPTDVLCEIKLKDPNTIIRGKIYQCPRKYKESWKRLIDDKLASGQIRESKSPHVSPSFIIPKKDPTVLPRWVVDYRNVNANIVRDRYPLPRIDDVLASLGKPGRKLYNQFDWAEAFFQTRMDEDSIQYTATATPFGIYEFTVMPMGLSSSPAVQQRRIEGVYRGILNQRVPYDRDLLLYVDDGLGRTGGDTDALLIQNHLHFCRQIFQACREKGVHLKRSKTHCFRLEIDALGHHIDQDGVHADNSKAQQILEWPTPRTGKDVQQFLGLVRYLAQFLPNLAEHARILNDLTTKEALAEFPGWKDEHQHAFDAIKHLVTSRQCLTAIDHDAAGMNIYVTTDASDFATGAVLSFGETWETARPVAYDSVTFKGPELNYPTHEKELLAIIRALKKWKADLLGSSFFVYTDHKTLLNFHKQSNLSRRQMRWMEELAIYDCKFVYVRGEDNTVADALSRLNLDFLATPSTSEAEKAADHPTAAVDIEDKATTPYLILDNRSTASSTAKGLVAALSSCTPKQGIKITMDSDWLARIKSAYATDPWCKKLNSATVGMKEIVIKNGLWFLGSRLIVPDGCGLREALYRLAHDDLGHYGAWKSFDILKDSYFWPAMRSDLETKYVPSCVDCQRNKTPPTKPKGPLHPLPIPDDHCDSIAMDFIGPLPEDDGFNCLLTITDRLGSDIQLVPCRTDDTAKTIAEYFLDRWYCENGLPSQIVSDRDKLFLSQLWNELQAFLGVDLAKSSAYHPQTDGASERTNRTIIQALRFHVERNQKGWAKKLPRVRFQLMNTTNKSTGFSPFQLRYGRSPRLIPPIVDVPESSKAFEANELLDRIRRDVASAKDNLMLAKISQAYYANRSRAPEKAYNVGDRVMLSTKNRRHEYRHVDEHRSAKFMPRFDGPYTILSAHPESSTYTLDMKDKDIFPTFHSSLLRPFIDNDPQLFPGRIQNVPPTETVDGNEEHFIDRIVDARPRPNNRWKYLVRWKGFGMEHDEWVYDEQIDENAAVDEYWTRQGKTPPPELKGSLSSSSTLG